ncbi:MAG: FAD-binding oxidoreductase [Atopobiaceae bacterium]|jgi:D-lactate dehydrogenase (cytochrome)|nr:FAD-binding oxidoreductase [Atopobiaceae bacterium]
MVEIRPFSSDFEDYVRDESRSSGKATSISFPTDADEVREVVRQMTASGTPITVQGDRTGLAAGAVPLGGHVMSLTKMDRFLGLRKDEDGTYHLTVEPGVVLSALRKHLADKTIPTTGWDEASLAALDELYQGPEQFFPTDPTETSACLGGMVACNASGARSYRYGPVRPHVSGLTVVLASGETVEVARGGACAHGRTLELDTREGTHLTLDLPTYQMPHAKNASGYYAADDMDAIDLFIGSDGTLGTIVAIELSLMEKPAVVWGVSCFLEHEEQALDLVDVARPGLGHAAALEYLDAGALSILREQRASSAAFATLPEMPANAAVCVYVELDCADEDEAYDQLWKLGELIGKVGGSEDDTWVARTETDREAQLFFRHAVPESVNMLIDERRRTDPTITKLGSDMSVPDERLHDVVAMYRSTLAEAGLESAAWGHIGNNHLHVNVLPRDAADFRRGHDLFERWASEVTAMGGAVSAEHGVGKIKRDFLLAMYGERHIREMATLKLELDPAGLLGRGNLFPPELLPAVAPSTSEED